MGHWSMHIHGHGIHENGRADDADSMLRDFAAYLRGAGHVVHGVHFTAGTSQDLTNADPAPPAQEADDASLAAEADAAQATFDAVEADSPADPAA